MVARLLIVLSILIGHTVGPIESACVMKKTCMLKSRVVCRRVGLSFMSKQQIRLRNIGLYVRTFLAHLYRPLIRQSGLLPVQQPNFTPPDLFQDVLCQFLGEVEYNLQYKKLIRDFHQSSSETILICQGIYKSHISACAICRLVTIPGFSNTRGSYRVV